MAFSFKQESNKSWLNITVGAILVVAILVGAYLLFFGPTPLVTDVGVPSELEDIASLSKIKFSSADFADSAVFTSLRQHVSAAQPGPAGRENPFAPF